jgi:hypothetical protein
MTCDDCRRHLQARLDGEALCGDDVEAHLVHCSECRWLHSAADRLRVGLLAVPFPTPPIGLSERVVADVLRDRKRRLMRRRLVFVGAGLAAAAAVIVALVLFPSTPKQIANGDPKPTIKDINTPPLSLNENVAEATSAVASLAKRTADETVSNGQIVVSSVPLPLPTEDVPPLDPSAQSLRDAGHNVATGLEPVANSARQAFDRFLHDLPPMTPEVKSGL